MRPTHICGSVPSMSGGAVCGHATKWQLHEQRETHRDLLGLFTPWCSRVLLLRVFKDHLGAPDWALVLPLLPDVQMEILFQGCQPSMGSTLPRASRLSFPSHQPLLPAWGNPEFFLCPIISLCSCAVPARAVQEWCLGLSELSRVISSRENT